jgi:hypothetical protein
MSDQQERRAHDPRIAELNREIHDLKTEVAELRGDIKDLIEAWNTAKGMTTFVKWLSSTVVACGTLYALFKGVRL